MHFMHRRELFFYVIYEILFVDKQNDLTNLKMCRSPLKIENQKEKTKHPIFEKSALCRNRTCHRQLRRLLLYPTELRMLFFLIYKTTTTHSFVGYFYITFMIFLF